MAYSMGAIFLTDLGKRYVAATTAPAPRAMLRGVRAGMSRCVYEVGVQDIKVMKSSRRWLRLERILWWDVRYGCKEGDVEDNPRKSLKLRAFSRGKGIIPSTF
jgi:hypothetical protein